MQAGNDASPDVYNLTPEIYQTWNNQEFPKNTLWAKSVTLDQGLLKKKSKCTNCTGHTLLAISIGINCGFMCGHLSTMYEENLLAVSRTPSNFISVCVKQSRPAKSLIFVFCIL